MDDRPDAVPVALDLGDRPPGAGLGQLDRVALEGHEAARRRAPVDKLQRLVAERVGQRLAEASPAVRVVQALDQLAHGAGARPPAAHEARQERVGQDREADERDNADRGDRGVRRARRVQHRGGGEQQGKQQRRPQHRTLLAALRG